MRNKNYHWHQSSLGKVESGNLNPDAGCDYPRMHWLINCFTKNKACVNMNRTQKVGLCIFWGMALLLFIRAFRAYLVMHLEAIAEDLANGSNVDSAVAIERSLYITLLNGIDFWTSVPGFLVIFLVGFPCWVIFGKGGLLDRRSPQPPQPKSPIIAGVP